MTNNQETTLTFSDIWGVIPITAGSCVTAIGLLPDTIGQAQNFLAIMVMAIIIQTFYIIDAAQKKLRAANQKKDQNPIVINQTINIQIIVQRADDRLTK